jgi:hypothetical protein
MPRRKKRDTLTPQEMHAFLQSAEQLNEAICRPLISPQGAHCPDSRKAPPPWLTRP